MRDSRHSPLTLHCISKTMSMELINLAIAIHGPYAITVGVSHVMQPFQLHAVLLAQGWIITNPCCMALWRNCLISYILCKTNRHTLSTMWRHGITISLICDTTFTGCRYEVGSPSRWKVYATLHLDSNN